MFHLVTSEPRHLSNVCFSTSSVFDRSGSTIPSLLTLRVAAVCSLWPIEPAGSGSFLGNETEEAGTVISELRFDFLEGCGVFGICLWLDWYFWRKYLTKGRSPGTQAEMMMTSPSMLKRQNVSV